MAEPVVHAHDATTESGFSVWILLPAEAIVGDVIVLVVSGYGSDSGMFPFGGSWTQVTSQEAVTPFGAPGRHEVWVRDDRVEPGEPGVATLEVWQDEEDQINLHVLSVGNADPADLLDGTIEVRTSDTADSSVIDAPAVTTSTPNALVVRSYQQWSGGVASNWDLSGQTMVGDVGGWDRHALGVEVQAVPGVTAERQGQTFGSSGRQQVITFAIKGASAATPVTVSIAQTTPAFQQAASADATATVAAAQVAPAFTQAAAFDVDEAFTPDVVDEFDRADNPSLGGDWTIHNGLLGIENERAYATTPGYSLATLDCGSSNGEVRLDVPVLGGEWWLIFRLTDASNYWRFGTDGSNDYTVQAIVEAGIAINIDTGVTPQAGDRLSVVADDRDLDFQVNGVSAATVTQSFNAHATNHGIAVFSPGGDAAVRFERFAMQTAPTVVQTPGVVVDDFEVDDGPLLAASAGQRWHALQGDWQVEGGKARHTTSNGFHGQVVVDGAEPDGALTVNITLADVDTVAGVIVRGIDEMNHILIEPTVGGPNDENKIGVYKREAGTYSAIVDQPMSLVPGATHDLTIWVDGDHFVVRLDGDFLFDFTLSPTDAAAYAGGTLVGLYSHRQSGFDDGTTRFNSFQWLAGVGAPVIAALAQTAPAFTQSAGVEVGPVEATIAQTAPAFTQGMAAEVDTDPHGPGDTVTISAAQVAPAFTQAAAATVSVSAALAQTAPAFTQATDVGVTVTAEVGQQAPAFTQATDVTVSSSAVTIDLAQTAPAFSQAATFESAYEPPPYANRYEAAPLFTEAGGQPQRFLDGEVARRFLPGRVATRFDEADPLAARFHTTTQPGRFFTATVYRLTGDADMELEVVDFGPFTQGDRPQALWVRCFDKDPDGVDQPMVLHGTEPAWTARVAILPPSGEQNVIVRPATIPDPDQLDTIEPRMSGRNGEDGWVIVTWEDGDFDEAGSPGAEYQVQVILDNTGDGGAEEFALSTVYQPNVRPGPATPDLVDA